MRFEEGSYAYVIAEMICLNGEMPWSSISLLNMNDIIVKRTIGKMKKKGYVTVVGKGVHKTVRITKKLIDSEKINPLWIENYLRVTNNHKFRGGTQNGISIAEKNIRRNHRFFEVSAIVKNVGYKQWFFEKPILEIDNKINHNYKHSSDLYYSSKEIKSIDIRQRSKIDFTRFTGLLLSMGGTYLTYNINKGLIKWNAQGEQKAQLFCEKVCASTFGITTPISSSIIFAKTMEPMYEILTSKKGIADPNGFEMLSFSNIFPNTHFLTLDSNGENQLHMLSQLYWKEKLIKAMFPENMIADSTSTVDCDAIDKENRKFILLFLDGDILRLNKFKEATTWVDNFSFEVICFPWQKDVLQKFLGKDFSIIEIDLDSVMGIF